jgi:hypothetical protein
VDKALARYNHIAHALMTDSLDGVHDAAVAWRPLAVEVGGEAATAPAAQLEAARSIEDIRAAFAALSEVLVPRFLDANLPGVVGFVCTMKKAQWAQRGTTVANPTMARRCRPAACRSNGKDNQHSFHERTTLQPRSFK